jgi:hypothetical protein
VAAKGAQLAELVQESGHLDIAKVLDSLLLISRPVERGCQAVEFLKGA